MALKVRSRVTLIHHTPMKDVQVIYIGVAIFVLISLVLINTYRLFLFRGDFLATNDSNIVSKPNLTASIHTQKFEVIQPTKNSKVPTLRKFQDVSEENSINIAQIENEVDQLTDKLHRLQQQLNSINYDVDQ